MPEGKSERMITVIVGCMIQIIIILHFCRYGQQERPNPSNSSTSATGNLLAERGGPSAMNRSPFSLRGRGRGRGRGSVSPHNPQIAHRFPQSRDSSGMSHMYPGGGGRRY